VFCQEFWRKFATSILASGLHFSDGLIWRGQKGRWTSGDYIFISGEARTFYKLA
jgi:hypothetical protein